MRSSRGLSCILETMPAQEWAGKWNTTINLGTLSNMNKTNTTTPSRHMPAWQEFHIVHLDKELRGVSARCQGQRLVVHRCTAALDTPRHAKWTLFVLWAADSLWASLMSHTSLPVLFCQFSPILSLQPSNRVMNAKSAPQACTRAHGELPLVSRRNDTFPQQLIPI